MANITVTVPMFLILDCVFMCVGMYLGKKYLKYRDKKYYGVIRKNKKNRS